MPGFEDNRLEAIREYLKTEFNTSDITDEYVSNIESQKFRIVDPNRIYILIIAGEFIEDYDAKAISRILKRYILKSLFEADEKIRTLLFRAPGEKIRIEY
jgi:hypothetical protein